MGTKVKSQMRFRLALVLGLVVGLLFLNRSFSYSQNIKVLSFKEFEPHLSFSNDTTYLINFWATWCTPCVEEIPAINQLAKDYSDKKLKILLVSLDFPQQIESRLIPFIRKYGLVPEVMVLDDPDFDSWINRVSPDWSGAIPATLVYRNGVRDFYEKSFSYAELEDIVNQKLK